MVVAKKEVEVGPNHKAKVRKWYGCGKSRHFISDCRKEKKQAERLEG